jgi:PAS domain S-box-containing protein
MALKDFHKIIISVVAATALVVVAGAVAFGSFKTLEASSTARVYTANLVFLAQAFLTKLIDADRSQRGYALTGDRILLAPYLGVIDGILPDLEHLQKLTISRPSSRHIDAVVPLVNTELAQMAKMVDLRQNQNLAALNALISSEKTMHSMDSIRDEAAAFIQAENRVLDFQNGEINSRMSRLFGIIIVICGLSLLLPISFSYQIYEGTQTRMRNLVHDQTKRLLDDQEDINRRLSQININWQISEEKLAVTLDSIDDAVIATDDHGRVTLMNPLAERLTGWARNEAMNLPVEEVFHIISAETREPLVLPVRKTLAEGVTLSMDAHAIVVARDGSECDIADSCAPIRDKNNNVVGAVLVFRDVRERTRHDRILAEKGLELEIAKSAAEKANLAKSDFLSSMSHELRTPLSAILGFAQLMDSGTPPPSPSQKRGIEQILKAGWYLLDLINEILDLALIESGKLSLSMEPISLAEVAQECQVMIEPQAQARGIKVTFPVFDGPCYVFADRIRVKQILINLLSNAVKYNALGKSIDVSYVTTKDLQLRISVADSGKGLTREKMNQLFQPFNRLGQETTAEEGTGIGLVVCKRLIELMGGAIGVESMVGKGSVFWIELQQTAEPGPAAENDPSLVARRAPMPAGSRLRTLLYVEDNPANMMLVEELITRRPDISMIGARDGHAGLKIALAERPDVILMDINLPGISGIDAMMILGENPVTSHIPVIALSANAMPRDIEKGLKAGFFRYLTKPIKVNEFMNTLDEAYAHSEAQRLAPKNIERNL